MPEWHIAHLSDEQLRAIRRLEEETGLVLIAWERGSRAAPRPRGREELGAEISPDVSALSGLGDVYRSVSAPAP